MRTVRLLAASVALATLAGCQMAGPGSGPVVRAPSGVDGDWVGTDGVAVSRFSNGAFETYARDTGNKLAQGSYSMRDSRTIDITLTSLIRQTTSSVVCSMVTSTQLNCTSSSGNQFVLVRRTGVS